MLTGAAAMGLGLAVAAFAQSLWPIYLGLGVLAGVASTAALFLPCIALVSNWFTRLRGRALGLVTLGPTLSGAVVPVVLSLLVDEVGWSASLLLAAGVATAILLPVIWFFVRDRPEDCDQLPDGDPESLTHPGGGIGRDLDDPASSAVARCLDAGRRDRDGQLRGGRDAGAPDSVRDRRRDSAASGPRWCSR